MSVLNQGPGPFPHLAEIARKYRAIADDLDRIARGRHPVRMNCAMRRDCGSGG